MSGMNGKTSVVLQDIRALKLAPGEILVVKCNIKDPDMLHKLYQEVHKAAWAVGIKNIQILVLNGDFGFAVTKSGPPDPALAGLYPVTIYFGTAIERDTAIHEIQRLQPTLVPKTI